MGELTYKISLGEGGIYLEVCLKVGSGSGPVKKGIYDGTFRFSSLHADKKYRLDNLEVLEDLLRANNGIELEND